MAIPPPFSDTKSPFQRARSEPIPISFPENHYRAPKKSIEIPLKTQKIAQQKLNNNNGSEHIAKNHSK